MNGAVCARAAELDSGRMGSTAVLLYLNAREAWVCNVGDSRAFLLRDGELRQLSVDHTDAGLLAAQGVRGRKPALTQHLGIRPEEMVLEPHFFREKLRPGDWYLLCSDGLTDMVSEEEIRSAAETAPDAGQCVRKLTEAALENGGRDNVTVIAVRIIPDP